MSTVISFYWSKFFFNFFIYLISPVYSTTAKHYHTISIRGFYMSPPPHLPLVLCHLPIPLPTSLHLLRLLTALLHFFSSLHFLHFLLSVLSFLLSSVFLRFMSVLFMLFSFTQKVANLLHLHFSVYRSRWGCLSLFCFICFESTHPTHSQVTVSTGTLPLSDNWKPFRTWRQTPLLPRIVM